MTEPNIPLLRKMVEWVEEQEERTEDREWYQYHWLSTGMVAKESTGLDFCDTAYCVAGKVAIDAGWQPILVGGVGHQVTRYGTIRPVVAVACEELGIRYDEIEDAGFEPPLFSASNTAEDIRHYAERLAGEQL